MNMMMSIKKYIATSLYYLKNKGKQVHVIPKIDSAIRYGVVIGFSKGKLILRVFDYGLYYNKLFDLNELR